MCSASLKMALFIQTQTNNPAVSRDYLLLVAFFVFVPYLSQQLFLVLVYV